MTKLAYASFAAALVAITCTASAGDMRMMNMEKMDANKDGNISKDEYMKMYSTIDKNKDDMVDAREQKMSQEEGFILMSR